MKEKRRKHAKVSDYIPKVEALLPSWMKEYGKISTMIYLDYASNHPVRKEVLDEFVKIESTYEGNCNSIHGLGRESLAFFHEIDDRMYHLLNLDKEEYEVIYTSSASESNNMVIKGLFESYTGYSTNVLSSPFEHSSVNAALAYLKDKGADVLLLSSAFPSNRKGQVFPWNRKKEARHRLPCP